MKPKSLILVLLALCVCLSPSALGLDRQPSADYRARRQALAASTKGGFVLLFAPTEAEGPNALHGFHQDENFFYLTGWKEPGAALMIAPAGAASEGRAERPYTEILFLPAHNLSQERWTGPKLSADSRSVREVTGFDRVELLDKMRDEIVRLLPQPRALVFSDLPGYADKSASAGPLDWLKRANAFPNYVSFRDVKPLISTLRVVKDGGEMERIRRATQASMAAHQAALRAIKPGVTELAVSALMQYEFMKAGCERPAYAPIVGSGPNSTVLHYSEDSGTMQTGDVVVMDVAGEYAMYASDITRTAPISGKFTPRQREIYEIVLGAQQAAMDAFKQGVSTIGPRAENSLYKVAFDYINSHGKDKHGEPLGKYFIHGLSHYVGLEVHDVGDTSLPVPKGAVFTIEPGIYIPEEKLGIRIEDLYWVSPEGKLVRLTEGLPRTGDEVERAMAGR